MCNPGATKSFMMQQGKKTLKEKGYTQSNKTGSWKAPSKKSTPSKESAPPPVLRSSSSSASARNLGIKNRGNVNKRTVASGRKTSKARTFSRGN